jgi:KaiC/GvpD/RAD55 family RecA-like ATPase
MQVRRDEFDARVLDRLPPHDIGAEQGVLGCCLLDPGKVAVALERFTGGGGQPREVFYDLRHQVIFEGMVELGATLDVLTLQAWLHDRNRLETVGGVTYLSALPDATPSAANVDAYIGIVWEKFLARQLIRRTTQIEATVFAGNGITEGGIAQVEREFEAWQELARSGTNIAPQDLKQPGEYGDEVFAHWFREGREDAPGLELPISFPLRIRDSELSLICGEDGSGKSLFIEQTSLKLMQQGWKGCIASFEVKVPMTLWVMQRQLLGRGPRLEPTEANRKLVTDAMAWMNSRMWVYDFLGITNWRLLLDVMRYAREKYAVDFFVVDSIMRIGIPEDDFAMQALAASEFAAFTVQTGAHVFLVHHMNKSREATLKGKATGSKRWTDNANNVVEMQRNGKKKERLDELWQELKAKAITSEEFQAEKQKLTEMHDAKFLLGKQRYPGTPQNGSKWLWFDEASLQFRDEVEAQPKIYLGL